jgi:hypothetical protein
MFKTESRSGESATSFAAKDGLMAWQAFVSFLEKKSHAARIVARKLYNLK